MNVTAAIAPFLERNLKIAATLDEVFGRECVKVTSSSDPDFEWIFIEVDWHPKTNEQGDRMRVLCRLLLSAALGLASNRYHIRFA